jgi:hypothetical protein
MARSQAQRRAESERCAGAWRRTFNKSPVAGIAQRIRDTSKPAPDFVSVAKPGGHYRANSPKRERIRDPLRHRTPAAAVDRSQYLPHGNKREAKRRRDQIAAGSLRAENGLR